VEILAASGKSVQTGNSGNSSLKTGRHVPFESGLRRLDLLSIPFERITPFLTNNHRVSDGSISLTNRFFLSDPASERSADYSSQLQENAPKSLLIICLQLCSRI
jgi:hypothetical protein